MPILWQFAHLVEEIYLGTIVAVAIFAVVFCIAMAAMPGQTGDAQKPAADGKQLAPQAEHDASAERQPIDLNPEQVLALRYEQSAREEIGRCLAGGQDPLPPMCDYTLDLLVQSCKDPDSRTEACSDSRLVAYSKG